MSLEQWAKNGWLRPHKSSGKETEALLSIVDRDLEDAAGDISDDWQVALGSRHSGGCLLANAFGVSAAGVLSGHSCPCHGDYRLLTRGRNRADDIGSGKLGTRFVLDFADC